jgi:hypothetical protein
MALEDLLSGIGRGTLAVGTLGISELARGNKAGQQQAILSYLGAKSPEERANAAGQLIAAGASLSDLAKFEENQRIAENQAATQSALASLANKMDGGAGGGLSGDILKLLASPQTAPIANALIKERENSPEAVAAKKAAEVKAESSAKADFAAESSLPMISKLREYNANTFSMPYADTAPVRGYSRIFGDKETQEKQKNLELLKQGRLELASPLAKELGVNPTDKDFQASLDRIFDSNSSRESRAAQIDALEQKILAKRVARGGLNVENNTQSNTPAAPANSLSTIPEGATATNPKTGQKIIFKNGVWSPL